MRQASSAAAWAARAAASVSGRSTSTSQGEAMARHEPRHKSPLSPTSRCRACLSSEGETDLDNVRLQLREEVKALLDADLDPGIDLAALYIPLEPQAHVHPARRLAAHLDAHRARIELRQAVIGADELRHDIGIQQPTLVEVRGVLVIVPQVRHDIKTVAEGDAVAQFEGVGTDAPVVPAIAIGEVHDAAI